MSDKNKEQLKKVAITFAVVTILSIAVIGIMHLVSGDDGNKQEQATALPNEQLNVNNKNTENPEGQQNTIPSDVDMQFINNLQIKDISMQEQENAAPQTFEYLSTYGITRITELRSENINGWKYSFDSDIGQQKITQFIISSPEETIGINGDVKGKVILMGNIPGYKFTNDRTWHYVVPIGNTLIITNSEKQADAYAETLKIAKYIAYKLEYPEATIELETVGTQIYPGQYNSDTSTGDDSDKKDTNNHGIPNTGDISQLSGFLNPAIS